MWDRVVGFDVEVFVFDGSPQSFDEYIVECPASSVHADANVLFFEPVGESGGGELRSLVGVENFGFPDGECLLQGIDAEIDLQCVGQSPGQDIPTIPVHHGDQIHKALLHRHIGNICAPDLVGSVDREPPQQIGIDAVFGVFLRETRSGVDGFQPHFSHQALHSLAVDCVSQSVQIGCHSASSIERRLGILLIQ